MAQQVKRRFICCFKKTLCKCQQNSRRVPIGKQNENKRKATPLQILVLIGVTIAFL